MPRIPRGALAGQVLHILNRGNGRAAVFHQPSDYSAFVDLLAEAKRRWAMDLYAFAIMPNHFHLVGRPRDNLTLAGFMQWWLTAHVRRHHSVYQTTGHLWQGRFKSFPVEEDEHLLTVLRYTLLNPVRARIAIGPSDWPWTSLAHPGLIDPWPVSPPRDLASWLRDGISQAELIRVRASLVRRAPFGTDGWQQKTAAAAGLESTLRPRGRPQRASAEAVVGGEK